MSTTTARDVVRAVCDEVEQVIVGKRGAIETIVLGVLADGHVLLEDLPGLGKTLLARSLAKVLGLTFSRIQFTPDLLPSDLTGAATLDPATGQLAFRPGPVFTQVLLADELNRTPPKTQAALLEAMAEGQVTVDGQTRPLPRPFVVLATDNPIEYEGTYPLPEAQLDRFVARVRLGYLSPGDEEELVRRSLAHRTDPVALRTVIGADQVLALIAAMDAVDVHDDITAYIVRLVNATRGHPGAEVGASPRGSLALTRMARGHALLSGRDFVVPEDVKAVAVASLGHRIGVKPELWVRRLTGDDIVIQVLDEVATPPTRPVAPAVVAERR
ncbi:MAG: AAA family ATPase [Jatrophihabitans sp.]